jgi:uncharacterized membrane protein
MAANLVAILFEGETTADGMLATLRELEERGAIKLKDAAVASRAPKGERIILSPAASGDSGGHRTGMSPVGQVSSPEAEVKQTRDKRGRSVLAGGGIGLIVGSLLGGPVGGLLVGGLVGGLRDKGIDNGFINDVAQQLQPDSSAIFLLVEGGDAEQVLAELKPYQGRVLHTTLPEALEKQVRDALQNAE